MKRSAALACLLSLFILTDLWIIYYALNRFTLNPTGYPLVLLALFFVISFVHIISYFLLWQNKSYAFKLFILSTAILSLMSASFLGVNALNATIYTLFEIGAVILILKIS